MSWQSDLKGKNIRVNGVDYPDRKKLSLSISGASVTDDPVNDATNVSLAVLSSSVNSTSAGSLAISSSDWAGADSATTPLQVFVTAAGTITLPTDASRQVGTRVRVTKVGTSSFAVTISAGGSANIQQQSNGSVGTADHTITTTFEYSVEWIWSGSAWLTDFYSRKDSWITSSMIQASGFSVLGKSTTGTGNGESITFASNTILGRNASGGNVDDNTPNAYEFTESSTNAKAGFRLVTDLTGIADAGNDVNTIPITHGNGRYDVTVSITATDESGNVYNGIWTTMVNRISGAFTGGGLTPVASSQNDSEITIALTNITGNLRVTVTNGTGGGENINAKVCVSYTFIPFSSAATP